MVRLLLRENAEDTARNLRQILPKFDKWFLLIECLGSDHYTKRFWCWYFEN